MGESDYAITQKEAADFLNVSTKSISRYRKKGLPYKLILNPESGKQEVRFRRSDLERWDDGRQLLATYGRDSSELAGNRNTFSGEGYNDNHTTAPATARDLLPELLKAYKEQIEVLRDQVEDMREQLARRDRQIDDLMRLMVGLQLEFKPMPGDYSPTPHATGQAMAADTRTAEAEEVTEAIYHSVPDDSRDSPPDPHETARTAQQRFSRAQLSASVLHLRRKGKSYEEIAKGLNRIQVLPLSGAADWTAAEVSTLLPALVDLDMQRLTGDRDL